MPSRPQRLVACCAGIGLADYFKVLLMVVATVFVVAMARCLYYVVSEGLYTTLQSTSTWLWVVNWIFPFGRFRYDGSGVESIVPVTAQAQSAPSPSKSTFEYWSFFQSQFMRIHAGWNKHQLLWRSGPLGTGALVAWGLYSAQQSN